MGSKSLYYFIQNLATNNKNRAAPMLQINCKLSIFQSYTSKRNEFLQRNMMYWRMIDSRSLNKSVSNCVE